MTDQFFLRPHAHLAVSDGQYIILDARSGKYFGFTREQARALSETVIGWPRLNKQTPPNRDPNTGSHELTQTLRSMIEADVLTATPAEGKNATPVSVTAPSMHISAYFPDLPEPLRLAHVAVFMRAVILASTAMRWFPLRHIVARCERRKRAKAMLASAPIAKVSRLVSAYNRLRVITFSARDACFLDSFTLIEFLALQGIFPRWVFAVRTAPFAAHCWVEHEGIVLNDTVDYVGQFTPIMYI